MPNKASFTGFSKETVSFFTGLRKNNSKQWFDAHREQYEEQVKAPARDFVVTLGQKLQAVAPHVVADPRVNKSLFRINRDMRFSKDNSPYKTHMGLWLWEGPAGTRMENSGFYFHLEPPRIMVGVGIYCFPTPMLKAYRQDVVHPVHGEALAGAIKAVERQGMAIGGEHYKRVPRGFDPDHRNADYLRFNGMYAGTEMKIPAEFFTAKLVNLCVKQYKKAMPLHQWLLAFTERHH